MTQYKKKPVVIEAVQWLGTESSTKEVLVFMGQDVTLNCAMAREKFQDYCDLSRRDGLTIWTLEDGKDKRANHVASVCDWVIKGVQGEFYPCKPDIFELTYDEVI